jgi:endonuclease/exonuclease/phosphatase family metal-dependent hydrolase
MPSTYLKRLTLIIIAILITIAVFPAPHTTAYGTSTGPKEGYIHVMTYNIHVGVGMDKKLDLQRIADVIMSDGRPALVALQEVDRGVKRTQGKDEIAELARLTGMEYAFAPNLDYQGGKYGVAILSRFPILAIDHRRYANLREAERRGYLRVEVMIKGRKLNFVTTHLDYQHADGRLFEAEQLLKALQEVEGPIVVAGDFNDEPNGTSYALMISHSYTDAWRAAMKTPFDGYTYPADKPVKRIDYIFAGKGVEVHGVVSRSSLASDHLPLAAGLTFR